MRKFVALYILILSAFLSSCITRPDYVLDEEKMADVLYDVHVSEAFLDIHSSNSQFDNDDEYKKAVMAAVLVKQGVSRAQYDSSLVWYGQNLKYLIKVYNKIQKRIGEEITYWEENDRLAFAEFDVSEAGDDVELWSLRDFYVFNEKRYASYRFWEIRSDSNYVAGDTIVWHFHLPEVPKSHMVIASLSLNYPVTEFDFPEPISKTLVLRQDTTVDITCVSKPFDVVESVIASISVIKDSVSVPDCYLFVDSLSLRRIHKQ